MGLEIERKFLIANDAWRAAASVPRSIRQGYLARGEHANVRVRIIGKKAFLTVKSNTAGLVRQEFEYAIPLVEARAMLSDLCGELILEKQRFTVSADEIEWTIDLYEGRLAGLVLAEVELFATDQEIALPTWVGVEVTDDPRFRNEILARNGAPPKL